MTKKLAIVLFAIISIFGLGFLTGHMVATDFESVGLKNDDSQLTFRQDQIIYTLLSAEEFHLEGYIFERQGEAGVGRTKNLADFYTNPKDEELHFRKISNPGTIYSQDNNGVEIHIFSIRESNSYPYLHLIGKIWMPTKYMDGVKNIQDLKRQAVLHGALFKLGQNNDAQKILQKYFGKAKLVTGYLGLEAGVFPGDDDH